MLILENRLFRRLLLIFWLTQLVFLVLTLGAASLYIQRIQERYDYSTPRQRVTLLVDSAQQALERGGMMAVMNWLRERDDEELVPLLLVDDNNRDILGREISPQTLDYIEAHENLLWLGEPQRPTLFLAEGVRYRFFYDYRNATMQRFLARPRVLIFPLLLASLVAAIVAYALAVYLSTPINVLRSAMRGFTLGKLTPTTAIKMGRRNDELADLASSLDDMVRQWAKILESHRNLLRDVSHDLRSPLARATVALSLLREKVHHTHPESEQDFNRVEKELERLNALISRILHFARLAAGTHKTTMARFDWSAMMADLLASAKITAEQKSCMLQWSATINDDEEAVLLDYEGDENLWQSAIENVLDNALRYAPKGSTININLFTESSPTTTQFFLSIEDEGRGVDEALLDNLFEPFFRADPHTMAQDVSGHLAHLGHTGLGLAIAKRAIKVHGGTIRAYNRAQGGLGIVIAWSINHEGRIEKSSQPS